MTEAARNGHPRFFELLESMRDTHERKNADYAGRNADPLANFRRSERLGIRASHGCATRFLDKLSRFEELFSRYVESGQDQPAVATETIFDTLLDIANYSLILTILLEEEMQP